MLTIKTHYRKGQKHLAQSKRTGGDEGIRTPGLLRAREALSHLSYIPAPNTVGLRGLEPRTPPLSEVCSYQLSYRPPLTAE